MIPISIPLIETEEKNAVISVLDSKMLVQGKKVKELETNFAEYIGTEHAIATCNGTTALELAMLAAGIKDGEVITTPFSFISSANSIIFAGGKPVFVDINESFNINPELIEDKITEKTKAIMPVHLYGNPCDMDKIMEIANKNNLVVIEDSCQSHGSEYKNKKTGSFGIGCFSMYATKNMTTGEGGMITTNDKEISDKSKLLRDHGQHDRYYHKVLGHNYRMTDIAAAIGIEQLKKLDNMNNRRIENAKKLTDGLKWIKGLITPSSENKHVYHQYTLRITDEFSKTRDELADFLTKNGIGNAIYYPVPIHMQEVYNQKDNLSNLSISEKLSKQVISIPVHPNLTDADLEKIIGVIRNE